MASTLLLLLLLLPLPTQLTNSSPPLRYVCDVNTLPTEQFRYLCGRGYYCLRGTPLYLATRNKCPVGYYCPGGTASGSSAETRCPRATTTLTGAGQLADCRIEEVDVCDKKGVDPFNVFEDQTYYPKHAYPLLTEGAEMQVRGRCCCYCYASYNQLTLLLLRSL